MATATDDFTRANSATSLGTATTGQVWGTPAVGTWGINTNKGYCPTPGTLAWTGSTGGLAVLDLGDLTVVQIDITAGPTIADTGYGIVGRYLDTTNMWFAMIYGSGTKSLFAGKVVAGTQTYSLASNDTTIPQTGPWTLKLQFSGNSVSAWVNGTQYGSTATDAFNNDKTKAGLLIYHSGTEVLFDNFSATYTPPQPHFVGTIPITIGASATTLNVKTPLSGWTADQTQGANIRFSTTAALTVPAVLVPPPTAEHINIGRVSPLMPSPTLDANGRPVNWTPTSVTEAEWGRLQVVVNGTDVTYYQGVPAQVRNLTYTDPFADAHAEIVFPQLSVMVGAPSWLVDFSNVEINKVAPNGTITPMWEGFVASIEVEMTQSEYGTTLACMGALFQYDLLQKKPSISLRDNDPAYAQEVVSILVNELNQPVIEGLVRCQLAKVFPGQEVSGVKQLRRGNVGKLLSGYILDLLNRSTVLNVGTVANPTPQWTQYTLMKQAGRVPYLKLRDLINPSWTITAGTPGMTLSLSRDLTMVPNAIYGQGTAPDHCRWGNIRYPNIRPDTAPVWPGTFLTVGYVGVTNPGGNDTQGTTDVKLWKGEAAKQGYGVDATVNTYSASDAAACRKLQAAYGIQVDGVVGPQTWAATFNTGANSGDLSAAYYAPLAELPSVEPFLYLSNGAKTSLTPNNPAFAANKPGLMRVEKFEGPFPRTTKDEAVQSAADEITRYWPASYLGTITLEIDPEEGSRFDIRAEDNIQIRSIPSQTQRVTDSFTRGDGPLVSTETGQTWLTDAGTPAVLSNKLGSSVASRWRVGTSVGPITLKGLAVLTVQASLTYSTAASSTNAQLIFRRIDANNYFYAYVQDAAVSIHRVQNGVDVSVATGAWSATVGSTHTVAVLISGDVGQLATVQIDSVTKVSYTLTTPEQATFATGASGVGLGVVAANANQALVRWDTFVAQTTVLDNTLFHISRAEHDFTSLRTTLTVDTKGRDIQTIQQVKERDRDIFDPVGRPKVSYYSQRKSSQVQDEMPEFDCESGAGVIPYQGIFARLWNVERIPFAEAGNIVRVEVTAAGAYAMSMGVFDQPISHSVLRSYSEPDLDDDYWDAIPDTYGLIMAHGAGSQMMGHYPGLDSNEDPKTGRFVDDSPWYYETKYTPWLWVAIWCEATTYISGRFYAQAAGSV